MDRRNESQTDRSSYQGTMIAAHDCYASSRDQSQPTRLTQQQEPIASGRRQPHATSYDRFIARLFVCRCASPMSHGDAYTEIASRERYDGIPRRDTTGRRMTWEEEMHRLLDAVGKDYASRDELPHIYTQVYQADTARMLHQKDRNFQWALERGVGKRFIPHDVIWHGSVNPTGCRIGPRPEQEGEVFVSANGGYRPGPSASAQGTRLQGRCTTLGYTWGASQIGSRRR
jgi:hypothetical protein